MSSTESFLLEHPYLVIVGWLVVSYLIVELLVYIAKDEERDAKKDK